MGVSACGPRFALASGLRSLQSGRGRGIGIREMLVVPRRGHNRPVHGPPSPSPVAFGVRGRGCDGANGRGACQRVSVGAYLRASGAFPLRSGRKPCSSRA